MLKKNKKTVQVPQLVRGLMTRSRSKAPSSEGKCMYSPMRGVFEWSVMANVKKQFMNLYNEVIK